MNNMPTCGVYELNLKDVTPKEIFVSIKDIIDEIENDYNGDNYDSRFEWLFMDFEEIRDDIYDMVVSNLVMSNQSDGKLHVALHWSATDSICADNLTRDFALALLDLYNAEGAVTMRMYGYDSDGDECDYKTGLLRTDDTVSLDICLN